MEHDISTEIMKAFDAKSDDVGILRVSKKVVFDLIEKALMTSDTPQEVLNRIADNPLLPVEGVDEASAPIVRAMAICELKARYTRPLIGIEIIDEDGEKRPVTSTTNVATFLTLVKEPDYNNFINSLSDDEFDALKIKPFVSLACFFSYITEKTASGFFTPDESSSLICEACDSLLRHDTMHDYLGWECEEEDRHPFEIEDEQLTED